MNINEKQSKLLYKLIRPFHVCLIIFFAKENRKFEKYVNLIDAIIC